MDGVRNANQAGQKNREGQGKISTWQVLRRLAKDWVQVQVLEIHASGPWEVSHAATSLPILCPAARNHRA